MIMPNLMTRGRRDVCMSGNDRISMADILAGIFHFADRSGMAQMTAEKDRHLWGNGEIGKHGGLRNRFIRVPFSPPN